MPINATNEKTSRPDVDIHFTIAKQSPKNTVTVRGYAVKSGTQTRIDGSKTLTRKNVSNDADAINRAKKSLRDSVLSSLPQAAQTRRQSGTAKNALDSNNAMVKAYQTLESSNTKVWDRWNREVNRRWLLYFKNNVLPKLQEYVSTAFTVQDREELREAIIEGISNKGNSKAGQTTVLNTAYANLAASQKVYDAMRRTDPTLPLITLSPESRLRQIRQEQVKALPDEVRIQFAQDLVSTAETLPKQTLCAVLMFAGAFRTAEAAGVDPWTDITFTDFGCTVTILFQEKDGARCPTLKTNNAYRTVVIPAGPTSVIRSCLGHLTRPTSPQPLMKADALSAWVKDELSKFISDSTLFWEQVYDLAYLYPDKGTDGNYSCDVTAYVLRRDCASRWRNKCGLTQDEIDYLLGHESATTTVARPDYRLPSEQQLLSAKMERDTLFPSGALNPSLTPISLCADQDNDYIAYEDFSFVNDSGEELYLKINIYAEEAGSTICISRDATITLLNDHKISKHTKGVRENKPAIGSSKGG